MNPVSQADYEHNSLPRNSWWNDSLLKKVLFQTTINIIWLFLYCCWSPRIFWENPFCHFLPSDLDWQLTTGGHDSPLKTSRNKTPKFGSQPEERSVESRQSRWPTAPTSSARRLLVDLGCRFSVGFSCVCFLEGKQKWELFSEKLAS